MKEYMGGALEPMNIKEHIAKWAPHAFAVLFFAWMTWISGAVWNMNGDIHALEADVGHIHTEIADIKADIADVKAELSELRSEISDMQKSLGRIEGYLRISASENGVSSVPADSVGVSANIAGAQ